MVLSWETIYEFIKDEHPEILRECVVIAPDGCFWTGELKVGGANICFTMRAKGNHVLVRIASPAGGGCAITIIPPPVPTEEWLERKHPKQDRDRTGTTEITELEE